MTKKKESMKLKKRKLKKLRDQFQKEDKKLKKGYLWTSNLKNKLKQCKQNLK